MKQRPIMKRRTALAKAHMVGFNACDALRNGLVKPHDELMLDEYQKHVKQEFARLNTEYILTPY